jgi:hypothetical protein
MCMFKRKNEAVSPFACLTIEKIRLKSSICLLLANDLMMGVYNACEYQDVKRKISHNQ